jgi:RNA polymerase sigma-70 factor (ECF subfamily)
MESLVQQWEQRLYYYIRRLTGQEADAWDVLQNVWVRVFRSIGSLRRPESFACWLYSVARNTALTNAKRRQHRTAASEELETAIYGAGEPDAQIAVDNAEALHHALKRLSEPHQEVLTLFFLNDLSIAEIGKVVGLPEGTVKSRLHYAKLALRRTLESG